MTGPPDNADERIPRTAPAVAPVPAGSARPRWSVLIPVYNQGRYLEQAMRSVLEQDPGPSEMQILVSDDASTDMDLRALVERVAGSRVEYFRHERNVGSLHNINRSINAARGHLVHLLHGDDRVLPGFYPKMAHLLETHAHAGAAFCGVGYIDESGARTGEEAKDAPTDGIVDGWLERIALGPRIQYASLVVRRSVYEAVGGYFGVSYGEDWEMHVRIASRYPMVYTPALLSEYRIHRHNISGAKLKLGLNMVDLARVIEIIQDYLPADKRQSLRDKAERACAMDGIHNARILLHHDRDPAAAHRQLRAALRVYSDEETCRKAMDLYAEISAVAHKA